MQNIGFIITAALLASVRVMTKDQLLAEIEDILRNAPTLDSLYRDRETNVAWLGRVASVIAQWEVTHTMAANHYIHNINGAGGGVFVNEGFLNLLSLLHEARHDLRLKTVGPLSVAVGSGLPFDYFDEVRKILELARQDVLFVDPYLDAEFVSSYIGHITSGVTIRLLASEKLSTLLPAVKLFVQQINASIEVRSTTGFHDRYVFIDRSACYQSGSSFKDGAKKSPTTLTQITDAFSAVLQTYEVIWSSSKVEYK